MLELFKRYYEVLYARSSEAIPLDKQNSEDVGYTERVVETYKPSYSELDFNHPIL